MYPAALTLNDIYNEMLMLLGRQLQRLGLISTELSSTALLQVCMLFCSHVCGTMHTESRFLRLSLHILGLGTSESSSWSWSWVLGLGLGLGSWVLVLGLGLGSWSVLVLVLVLVLNNFPANS